MCGEEGRGKYTKTPVEIAAKEYTGEMLNILGEFTEIPESVKLGKMSDLLFTTEEVAKIQFRILLSSLPLDSVRGDWIVWSLNSTSQVNTRDVRGYGTILQEAVFFDRQGHTKQPFVQILLDFGFVSFSKF